MTKRSLVLSDQRAITIVRLTYPACGCWIEFSRYLHHLDYYRSGGTGGMGWTQPEVEHARQSALRHGA